VVEKAGSAGDHFGLDQSRPTRRAGSPRKPSHSPSSVLDCCVSVLVKCCRSAPWPAFFFLTILILFGFWNTTSDSSDVHVNKVLLGDLICTRSPKWVSKVRR
jgi:hypothetical protein